jgi:hypothetical protein
VLGLPASAPLCKVLPPHAVEPCHKGGRQLFEACLHPHISHLGDILRSDTLAKVTPFIPFDLALANTAMAFLLDDTARWEELGELDPELEQVWKPSSPS